MRKMASLALLATLVAAGVPATATHTHSITAPYLGGLGGTVDHGQPDVPYTFGRVICAIGPVNFHTLGTGCLGGTSQLTQHWLAGYGDDLQPYNLGYTRGAAVAQDAAFGTNLGLWLGLPAQGNGGGFNNVNDVLVRSCGTGGVYADTNQYVDVEGDFTDPGFTTLRAAVFIDTLYVDPATTGVCTASTGSISVTFAA